MMYVALRMKTVLATTAFDVNCDTDGFAGVLLVFRTKEALEEYYGAGEPYFVITGADDE